MHKVYSVRRGIEFRVGVKTKIQIAMIVIGLVLVCLNLDLIMEYIVAGF